MGFTIFTSSGNFNPSSYGLSTGDVIHVKCVGGGGGGGGAVLGYAGAGAGANGGASSFGNILTAAGGNAGTTGSTNHPAAQIGSCQGSCSGYGSLPYGSTRIYNTYYGGCGGHGWLPGVNVPTVAGCALSQMPVNISAASSNGLDMYPMQRANGYFTCFGNLAPIRLRSSSTPQYAAQTGTFGGYGGCQHSSNGGDAYYIGGAGGVGYGAGGGGGANARSDTPGGSGGNGGVIADIDYVLTSVSSIAVTVGAGGAGYDGTETSGGGGARGCVAIWW